MNQDAYIQGIKPSRSEEVWNTTELLEFIGECASHNQKLCDYGRYHTGLGYPPPCDFIHVKQSGGVIEHYVPDMTIRVRAGITLGELRRILADAGQWLPLDGDDDNQTIDDIIAHNVYGPLCSSFGRISDLLLGLHYVDSLGNEISVGGRTVKNVAGYDVTRLMVGSMNAIGLISEAVLRTWAIPQHVTRIKIEGLNPAILNDQLTQLLTSDGQPAYIDFIWHTSDNAQPTTYLGYFGTDRGCKVQVEAMKKWLKCITADIATKNNIVVQQKDGSISDDHTSRSERRNWQNSVTGLVKVIVPAGLAGRFVDDFRRDCPHEHTVQALIGQGIIRIGGDWNISQANDVDQIINQLLSKITPNAMRLWYQRPENTPTITPFSPGWDNRNIMRKLKTAMDPTNIFNPGRLFDNNECLATTNQ